jgi:hypothetical protein
MSAHDEATFAQVGSTIPELAMAQLPVIPRALPGFSEVRV